MGTKVSVFSLLEMLGLQGPGSYTPKSSIASLQCRVGDNPNPTPHSPVPMGKLTVTMSVPPGGSLSNTTYNSCICCVWKRLKVGLVPAEAVGRGWASWEVREK